MVNLGIIGHEGRAAEASLGQHERRPMSDDDYAYDLLWREVFKEPLPMLGGGEAVRRILTRAGVSPRRITVALARAKVRTSP